MFDFMLCFISYPLLHVTSIFLQFSKRDEGFLKQTNILLQASEYGIQCSHIWQSRHLAIWHLSTALKVQFYADENDPFP